MSHRRLAAAVAFTAWVIGFTARTATCQDPVASTRPRGTIEAPDSRPRDREPSAALFRAAGFPTIDAPALPAGVLDDALRGLPVTVLPTVESLRTDLRLRRFDVLILPYGSAFPLDAWSEIRAFIEGGGGLVVLGGAPFHQPVRGSTGDWIVGPRQ